MHNGTNGSSRRTPHDDRALRGDSRTNGGRSVPLDRSERDDFGDNDFRRGVDRSQPLSSSSSERQQLGQGYGQGSSSGDDREQRYRDQGGNAHNGGYSNSGFGQERYDGPQQGYGREQGYSSSSQRLGQQGLDRGYDDRDHRQGYGMSRDLDDRTSRAGYRLDGDLDRGDVAHRRDAVSFTERDRGGRLDHHGFDDRGIGGPQRSSSSWSGSDSRDHGYGARDQGSASHGSARDRNDGYGASRGVDTDNSTRWSQSSSTTPRYPSGPKGYQRSDDRIKEDVCDRLAAMGDLDSSEVEVSVSGGEVTLTGTVPVRAMKYRCEQTCELISGVKEIVNHIRVNDRARSSNDNARSSNESARQSSSSSSNGASDSATGSTMNANANNKAAGTTTSTARSDSGKADGKSDDSTGGHRRQ